MIRLFYCVALLSVLLAFIPERIWATHPRLLEPFPVPLPDDHGPDIVDSLTLMEPLFTPEDFYLVKVYAGTQEFPALHQYAVQRGEKVQHREALRARVAILRDRLRKVLDDMPDNMLFWDDKINKAERKMAGDGTIYLATGETITYKHVLDTLHLTHLSNTRVLKAEAVRTGRANKWFVVERVPQQLVRTYFTNAYAPLSNDMYDTQTYDKHGRLVDTGHKLDDTWFNARFWRGKESYSTETLPSGVFQIREVSPGIAKFTYSTFAGVRHGVQEWFNPSYLGIVQYVAEYGRPQGPVMLRTTSHRVSMHCVNGLWDGPVIFQNNTGMYVQTFRRGVADGASKRIVDGAARDLFAKIVASREKVLTANVRKNHVPRWDEAEFSKRQQEHASETEETVGFFTLPAVRCLLFENADDCEGAGLLTKLSREAEDLLSFRRVLTSSTRPTKKLRAA